MVELCPELRDSMQLFIWAVQSWARTLPVHLSSTFLFSFTDVQVDVVFLAARYQLHVLLQHTIHFQRLRYPDLRLFPRCPRRFLFSFLKANFPADETRLPIRPDRDLNVISLETRAAALRPFRPPPYLIPSVFPHFFSSRWLLMRLPSNLLSVNRPPTKYGEHFFHLLRLERATERVRRHYALAHNPQKECRRIAVFNQTEDDRWDDCSRQITSSVSNRALI